MKGKKPYLIEIEKELKLLYKKWPEFRKYLKKLGCPKQSAEDLFQEALLIFSRKRQEPDFILTVDAFYYVRNTGKLLWYNQARKEQKQATFTLESDVEELNDEWFQKEILLRTMESAIEKLGGKCQEILQLFYGLGWNMVDIAKKVGLRNDKVAKAQKYRCLTKAKELIAEMENETSERVN
jgi:RNA polymerase sigma factor (sigma-70 family)